MSQHMQGRKQEFKVMKKKKTYDEASVMLSSHK